MSIVRTTELLCDRCGARIGVEAMAGDPFHFGKMTCNGRLLGWIEPREGRHLCPECSAPFLERKRAAEAELRELAGIADVELEV